MTESYVLKKNKHIHEATVKNKPWDNSRQTKKTTGIDTLFN